MPRQTPPVTVAAKARLEQRESLKNVGNAARVPLSLIAVIEKRQRPCVQPEVRRRWARYLGKSVDDLFDEHGYAKALPGVDAPPLPPLVYAAPTPTLEAKVVRMARAGKPRYLIMRETGLAISTVDKIRREAGLTEGRGGGSRGGRHSS